MAEVWNIFRCNIDHKKGFFVVRLDLIESAPIKSLPTLLALDLTLRIKHENGLVHAEEAERLSEFEDELEKQLRRRAFRALHVGRTTTDGRRTFYFYMPGEPQTGVLESVITRLAPEYEFEIHVQADTNWNVYRDFLFPAPVLQQQFLTRQVLDALEADGDPLDPVRHTLHWLYFVKQEDRDKFIQALPEGFDVIEPLEPLEGATECGVRLEHQTSMSAPVIDMVVEELFMLAEEHGGEYDGFECKLVSGTE